MVRSTTVVGIAFAAVAGGLAVSSHADPAQAAQVRPTTTHTVATRAVIDPKAVADTVVRAAGRGDARTVARYSTREAQRELARYHTETKHWRYVTTDHAMGKVGVHYRNTVTHETMTLVLNNHVGDKATRVLWVVDQ